MHKNNLLISSGPIQLIYGISVLQSQHQLSNVAGVISIYDTPDEATSLSPLDQIICNNFNLPYCDVIIGLPTKSIDFLKSHFLQLLFNKTYFFKGLSRRLLRHLDGRFNGFKVYLPYRPNRISDNFLLHMIHGQEVHYFQDGVYLKTNNNLISKSIFWLLGLKWYTSLCQTSFYTLPFLPERIDSQANLIRLEARCFYNVCQSLEKLFHQYDYKKQISQKTTVLIWQDLYPKFIKDIDLLYGFYKKIIAKEINRADKLIIKPHPRSSKKQYQDIKALVPSEYQGRIEILSNKNIKHVPIELLRHVLGYERVVGISSTALLSLNSFGNYDIGIYCDKSFPKKFKREVEMISKQLRIKVSYV